MKPPVNDDGHKRHSQNAARRASCGAHEVEEPDIGSLVHRGNGYNRSQQNHFFEVSPVDERGNRHSACGVSQIADGERKADIPNPNSEILRNGRKEQPSRVCQNAQGCRNHAAHRNQNQQAFASDSFRNG